MAEPDDRDVTGAKTSVPVHEEHIQVGSHEVATGRVILSKKVEERDELVDVPLLAENYRLNE